MTGPFSSVRLVVGLGNPGQAYAAHRHNVGFWCVKRLAGNWSIRFKSSRWARVGEGQVDDQPLVLAKPRTFVNRSGDAAASLLQRYELSPPEMLVICDDLDLPAGRLRLRAGGGHGGQKGLRSIIGTIGSGGFPRLRIGIGRPRTAEGEPITHPLVVAKYVLGEPGPEEQEALEAAVERAAEAVACVLREGLAVAMNRYN